MNAQYGSAIAGQTAVPLSGWETANDRLAEHTKRIDEQIDRLGSVLSPILTIGGAQSAKGMEAVPSHACELLQVFNSRADSLCALSVKLEELIQRIRL